jgi:CBS domain containing-hemolysin-like protein
MEILGLFFFAGFLYLLSGLISGSEAALFSLKPHDLEAMGPRATRIRDALEKPRHLLIVILMANLLVNTLAAGLVEGAIEESLGPRWIVLAVFVAGVLVLIFGEVTPKTIALRNNRLFASATFPLIRLFSFLLAPAVAVFLPVTKRLTDRFKGSREEEITEEDIKHLVSHSEDLGALDRSEERWIHSIFELDKKKAIDVMIPRDRVVALSRDVDAAAAFARIQETRYSRIPLFAGSLDQIVGVLYAKDMLAAQARGQAVRPARLAREPVFVPRWRRCDLLLNELRSRKTHIAIVVDEFGSTVGIVTLENIMEAIVGRIRDRRRERGAAHCSP